MQMNLKSTILVACMSLTAFAGVANATSLSGTVYCDANRDQVIDAGDLPLSAVEVVADHSSGVFFADVTNVDGEYVVPLHLLGDYVASLTAGTLPADASIVGNAEFAFAVSQEDPFEEHDWLVSSSVCNAAVCGDGYLDDGEACDDGNNMDGDGCSATCEVEIVEGGQGCTPGYWKQPHHFDSWSGTVTPDMLFSSVFEDAFPGRTLHDVLSQGGGGLKALGRHVVAALLNTASADVSYDVSTSTVIDSFNAAYPGRKANYNALKNDLMGMNEAGCPLN